MSNEKVIYSACVHNCPGRCVLRAHVRNGVIERISTDDEGCDEPHARQLRACARGRAYRQRVYHRDRLTQPLIRTGERGAGQFRIATWPEALHAAAEGVQKVRAEYGNESLYVHYGTGHQGLLRGSNLAQRLLGVYGGFLGYYNDYSTACTSHASRATLGTTATGNSYDDLTNARIVILWAANLADTDIGTGAPWHLSQARENGAYLVYVDPFYTDTAAFCDEWIPIFPGTDNALMDAMAFIMISEDLHDSAFLRSHCVGFYEENLPPGALPGSSYESYILGRVDGIPKTPEWASTVCGVPVATIVRLARRYATERPGSLIQGLGPQRAAYGEQPARGTIVLAAMTGNIGISGGGAAGQGICGRQMPLATVPIPNAVKASIPVFMWTDAIRRGKDMGTTDGVLGAEHLSGGIKLILNFQGNTLVNQHGDVNATAALLRDEMLVEFILVSEQFLTPSAKFADVVFPSVTWFERDDVVAGGKSGDYALFMNKAIEPIGDARSDYWALSRLAEYLDVGPEFTEGLDEEGWLRRLVSQSGIPNFEEFRRTGRYRRVATKPHVAFRDFRLDPIRYPLGTPSGKIEIYSQVASGMHNPVEIPAVPKYVAPWEGRHDPDARRFPLQLVSPHPPHRVHSTLGNVPWLQEPDRDTVFINPIDGHERGIAEGERVRVWNERGALLIRACITERIMPGVVAIYQGLWYAPGTDGVDEGGCANVLTSLRPSPWAKGNTQHSCLVQVSRTQVQSVS